MTWEQRGENENKNTQNQKQKQMMESSKLLELIKTLQLNETLPRWIPLLSSGKVII